MHASKEQIRILARSIIDGNSQPDPDAPIAESVAAQYNKLRELAVEASPILDRMLEPPIAIPAGVTYRELRERCEAVANLVEHPAPPTRPAWGRASR